MKPILSIVFLLIMAVFVGAAPLRKSRQSNVAAMNAAQQAAQNAFQNPGFSGGLSGGGQNLGNFGASGSLGWGTQIGPNTGVGLGASGSGGFQGGSPFANPNPGFGVGLVHRF